jgi:hypothetical protein
MLRSARSSERRRGVILLVVLSLLTLFALVGLTFVLYAQSARESSRLHLDAESQARPDVDPELLLAYFLGQLVFDVPDDERGVYSALRGHSLARNLFGMNYEVGPGGIVRNASGELAGPLGLALNDVPFNGAGRAQFNPQLPFPIVPAGSPALDDRNLINYTYFPNGPYPFLRDPERRYSNRLRSWRVGLGVKRAPYADGFNAPYTYPDLNNVYLAAVNANGKVLLPSYHRPWAGFGSLGPANWRWTSDIDPTLSVGHPLYNKPQPWLKYLVLRPRPADMGPGFPLPEDAGGDIKNLRGAPGGNDSIWIDLGFPVLRAPDGRKFKPLFAPLVVDLDGRVNLNVAGNLRGPNQAAHASHQGWGPWEINPAQLTRLPARKSPLYASALARRREWPNLLSGAGSAPGRYGLDTKPHPGGALAPGLVSRFYAPVDFDGSRELGKVGQPTLSLHLPGTGPTPAFHAFPNVPAQGGHGNSSAAERLNHPLLFDPFWPVAPDRAFPLSDLEALLRYGDTGSQALASNLLRLCPKNFADASDPLHSARRRRMVTLASFDQDRPGITPWFGAARPPGDDAFLRLPPRMPADTLAPAAGAVGPPPYADGEFGPDGRARADLTRLRRLNLNRYLPDYPPVGGNGRVPDTAQARTKFAVAEAARQYMAAEIFEVLWRVTGAGDPNNAAQTPPPGARGHDQARWDALRWLAQLAVNIVDFIDTDDYMTPFKWYEAPGRQEWVFGTELPRVVLNEVYVECANDPSDPGLMVKGPQIPKATRTKFNVWVELHNTFKNDPLPDGAAGPPHRKGEAQLEVPAAGSKAAYGAYRLLVAAGVNDDIRRPDNVLGELPSGSIPLMSLSSFSPTGGQAAGVDTRFVLPADAANGKGYFGKEGDNKGFYVLGPLLRPGEVSPFPAAGGQAMETLRRPELGHITPYVYASRGGLPKTSVLWQRLACPHLPPQPSPALAFYNPYVTVDYVRDVVPNYALAVGLRGPNDPPAQPVTERASWGRKQPYAAHPSQFVAQKPSPAHTNQPQHTFFQHNADASTPGPNWRVAPARYPPFDWLVHMDRQLVSPMELLHVSAFKPHELLQQFCTGDAKEKRFTHRAPWLDEGLGGTTQSHRLYRAFEFFSTPSRVLGMMQAGTKSTSRVTLSSATLSNPQQGTSQPVSVQALSGRTANGGTWRIEPGCTLVIDGGKPNAEEVVRVTGVDVQQGLFTADFRRSHAKDFSIVPTTVSERVPGKVNLNTVWDEEIFSALCDANPSNTFKEGAVRAAFTRLRKSRTVTPGGAPGRDDRPFLSLATGPGSAGASGGGIQSTLLRFPDGDSSHQEPALAVAGPVHPYQKYELLTKVFNHLTVRSNVFAVWVTVGLFEVTDDTGRPVKLGAELGRKEGRVVRHRMFAIVDRSVLTSNPGPQLRFDPRGPVPAWATGPVVPYVSIIE